MAVETFDIWTARLRDGPLNFSIDIRPFTETSEEGRQHAGSTLTTRHLSRINIAGGACTFLTPELSSHRDFRGST